MTALALLALLSGCNSISNLDIDSFNVGPHSAEQFDLDDARCAGQATAYTTLDLRGSSGSGFTVQRRYNRAYGDCMTASGYDRRSYLENIMPNWSAWSRPL